MRSLNPSLSNPWRDFENRIKEDSQAKGIFVSQIPTGCRIVHFKGSRKVIMVKTDFDFAAGCQGRAIFFDAKADSASVFNFKSYVTRENKIHQYRRLLDAERAGNAAGYLIWFYKLETITWVPVATVESLIRVGDKSCGPNTPGCRSQDDWIALDIGKLALSTRPVVPRGT